MSTVFVIIIALAAAAAGVLFSALFLKRGGENRDQVDLKLTNLRDEMGRTEQLIREQLTTNRHELLEMLNSINGTTENRLNAIRETLEVKFKAIMDENAKKLEEMRKTVDEKLQESVQKRFNESFKLIGAQLEMVQKGLGEMQTLANGVGDLKKVLTNVKTRGGLGEIQLGAILEQYLAPDQYLVNTAVKPGATERVEFAIKMPGREDDSAAVLLPIDSKFPVEDYRRLLESDEHDDPEKRRAAHSGFEAIVKKCAKTIHDKYIQVPHTTDFAVMFVPTEGLYAEILRAPGLFELLQRDHKVTVVGPANLVAFLNSLQMGFRTLAIEKRSNEVWTILGKVKTEFGKFGAVLNSTRLRLERAMKDLDQAGVRTRAIERQLRDVQSLPVDDDSPAQLGADEEA